MELKLLTQEVKARGVPGDEQVVDTQMQNLRGRFPTEAEFNKALAAQNLTAEKLKSEMLTQSGIAKLVETQTATAAARSPMRT